MSFSSESMHFGLVWFGFAETGSSTGLELANLAKLVGQRLAWVHLYLPLQPLDGTECILPLPALLCGL